MCLMCGVRGLLTCTDGSHVESSSEEDDGEAGESDPGGGEEYGAHCVLHVEVDQTQSMLAPARHSAGSSASLPGTAQPLLYSTHRTEEALSPTLRLLQTGRNRVVSSFGSEIPKYIVEQGRRAS